MVHYKSGTNLGESRTPLMNFTFWVFISTAAVGESRTSLMNFTFGDFMSTATVGELRTPLMNSTSALACVD